MPPQAEGSRTEACRRRSPAVDGCRAGTKERGWSALGGGAPPVRSGRISGEGRSAMLYEMRVYDCVPGRLPALLKRFESVTLGLWQKHGIRQAGFFTTLIGEHNQQQNYHLAWESLAEREKKWNTFMSDPEWLSARAASEKDGPILTRVSNQMLVPTSFSSVK